MNDDILMHACLEIQTLTELSPIWQMGVHANSDTEVVFSQFPGDRKHPGRSEAADPFRIWKELGSRPGQWQSTCLRVYVSTCLRTCLSVAPDLS